MKSIVLSIFLFFLCASAHAELNNVLLKRVYKISPVPDHSVTATGFFTEVDGKVALVTAKHVFEQTGFPTDTMIDIFARGSWDHTKAQVVYSDDLDLAVVKVYVASNSSGLPICHGIAGFDTMFYLVGFPFGMYTINDQPHFPVAMPFVKHAYLAGAPTVSETKRMLVLDAINDEGFSGGPVLMPRPDEKPFKACVVGTIVSYIVDPLPVRDSNRKVTPLRADTNSGLMYAVPGSEIIELFKKLPA